MSAPMEAKIGVSQERHPPAPTGAEPVGKWLSQQELLEQLGLVAVYAGIAQQLVEIGDSAGSDYALRRMGAHARAAIVARNFLNDKDADSLAVMRAQR